MSTVAIEQLASKIRFFFLSAEWEFRIMPFLRDRGDSIALDPFRPGVGGLPVALGAFGFTTWDENDDNILQVEKHLMAPPEFAAWWLKDATSEDPFEELLGHIRQGYEQKVLRSARKPLGLGALATGCVIILVLIVGGWCMSTYPGVSSYFTPTHQHRFIHP